MENNANNSWFSVRKIQDNLFLITEPFFYEGNRCNIWLVKGGRIDLIIDCGLGVCNLRKFLEENLLLDPVDKPNARPCLVVCTHVHFDHSGGAKDFENVPNKLTTKGACGRKIGVAEPIIRKKSYSPRQKVVFGEVSCRSMARCDTCGAHNS